jgi:SAM-dependent methyltransferase
MRENLLDLLAEPETGAPLRLEARKGHGDVIDEGELVSERTGKRYPIVRGIPRFVPAENYAETFGFQWNRFRTVQIDSETRATTSLKRFDAEARWTAETLRGKWVLDAGCGAGRFAEIAAERGANLVALDLSSAVEATAKTLSRFENVNVVQANMLFPPFRDGAFDYAYSLGVIQHTPDREAAIRAVVRCVRKGGEFAFAIYTRRPWTRLAGKYMVRPITKRMRKEQLIRVLEASMPVLFPLTNVLYRLPILGHVSKFVMPVANYVEREGFTEQQRYDEALLDTFDMLAPAYDEPMTPAECERALRAEGTGQWTFLARRPINLVGTR